ncbi:agamous-like MADS-box protein AGL61 [Andrographis paniculata]|uniref:agamous-like MADS-box protein AGL61 n=1 Tax=Andrographis paniculata TaxID=175694 RepID=UPI0021E88ACC|nr:agamous-like MADS-box protein AGL61 [Andrographis paniculata]
MGTGRRKIAMEKIAKKSSLQVTFSKRRKGIFKKASELAILTGAEVAIVVTSPADKVFAFGSPSVDWVLNKYQMGETSPEMMQVEVARRLEMEVEANGQCWWEKSIEDMELYELDEFLAAMGDLQARINRRLEELKTTENLWNVDFFESVNSQAVVPSTTSFCVSDLFDDHHEPAAFLPNPESSSVVPTTSFCGSYLLDNHRPPYLPNLGFNSVVPTTLYCLSDLHLPAADNYQSPLKLPNVEFNGSEFYDLGLEGELLSATAEAEADVLLQNSTMAPSSDANFDYDFGDFASFW